MVEVHLKKNFQYRTRGTQYSIPMPKPGTSKTGSGTGIILREDQQDFMRAVDKETKREKREYDKLMKVVQSPGDGKGDGGSVKIGDWTDPDWMPDMLIGVGKKKGGYGYSNGSNLPVIGMGRKNPNERRRK
jgi:RNA-binding protein NOB1